MGANSTKVDHHRLSERKGEFNRQDSLRRSSRRRSSKPHFDTIESILSYIGLLRTEIENYDGYREDERYKTIQKSLAKYAQDVEAMRSTKKDNNKRKMCDQAQREINYCLRKLESKVIENEKKLDVAAVESCSFINQAPAATTNNKNSTTTTSQQQQQQRNRMASRITRSFNTLDHIELSVQQLGQDIDKNIEHKLDRKAFVVLEKKVHILYTDLEMIEAEPHTPLHERKEHVGRMLVKCNNKLKRAKEQPTAGVAAADQAKTNARSGPGRNSLRANKRSDVLQHAPVKIHNMQEELQMLEARVGTFNGTRKNATFTAIRDDLNRQWELLKEIKVDRDSVRKLKNNLAEQIKHLIGQLKDRARQYEAKLDVEKSKLEVIRGEMQLETPSIETLAENVKSLADLEELHGDKEALLEQLEMLHRERERKRNTVQLEDSGDGKSNAKFLLKTLCSSIEDLTMALDEEPREDAIKALETFRLEIDTKLAALRNKNKENGVTEEPVYAVPFGVEATTADNGAEHKSKSNRNSMDIDKILEYVEKEHHTLRNYNPEKEKTSQSKPLLPQKPLHSVMDIDKTVQGLSKDIVNFRSNCEDNQYERIRTSLQLCSEALDDIPGEEVSVAKNEVRTQIERLQGDLRDKLQENCAKNPKHKDEDGKADDNGDGEIDQLKQIISEVKALKKRVDCFNGGVYKSAVYKQIEDELRLREQKLTELRPLMPNQKFKQYVDQVQGKIRNYLLILDEKSVKVVNAVDSAKNRQSVSYDSYKQLEEIRNRLLVIKSAMEGYGGKKRQDEFAKICADLMRCNEQLELIPDMESNSIKASKAQYYDYVKSLLKYFEDKVPSC